MGRQGMRGSKDEHLMQFPLYGLDGKYELIHELGSGGFGRVWLASDKVIVGRKVAIKWIRSGLSDEAAETLIEEMKFLDKLDHPHIVKFLHHAENDDDFYLVMEYCAGGSLDAFANSHPLDSAKVFEWGKTLAETFAVVHGHGIVHHDIKPKNILLTKDSRLKVADFGVANRNWGTRAYMAPELSFGEAESDDARIDIYALGVTLLELLLGDNPLWAFDGSEMLRAKMRHDFIPSSLPRWVQEILLKATHPTPESRFQTMTDFAEAITSRHVSYVINRDKLKAHRLAEKAADMIARKKWMTARNYIDHALTLAPDCVAALVTGGRIALLLRRTTQAKSYFSEALRISPRVNLQKELGWIALEESHYAQAISMLNDHLQREAADYEACNLLLQCFFETGRYELGEELAGAVLAQGIGNDCFENNRFLCQLLLEKSTPRFLSRFDPDKLTNPFMRINLRIATESPKCWAEADRPPLKSKLLFQDYRFGANEKRRGANTLTFDCGEGYVYTFQTPLVTLGRYDTNDIPLGQNGISRRHAVIVNYPGDVWLYDMGSYTGIEVDSVTVASKMFLDGVHVLKIGPRTIKVATNEGLLV